jgi:hypothetical protein
MDISFPVSAVADVTGDALTGELSDGRMIAVPLARYPRVLHGTPEERANRRFIGRG